MKQNRKWIVRQRLDTGMFYIGDGNGDMFCNPNGIVYFENESAASKMLAHIKKHNEAFNG
jgi:hypothetical protein